MAHGQIVVAICTYRRPRQLVRLLTALEEQENIKPEAVIVVDNDSAMSARDAVEGFHWAIYASEPKRGIATARNTSIRIALERLPWAVAFIDDDEIPHPRWLEYLARTLREQNADVSTGPVMYDTSTHEPVAISTDQYLQTVVREEGTRVRYVATNNTLVRSDWLRSLAFDTSFDLTGGSDLEYFLRLQAAGGVCVWSTRSGVRTFVPSERLTLRWNLQREMRNGQLMGRLRMKFDASSRTTIIREGIHRIGRGAWLAGVGVISTGRIHIRARLWLADGLGWLRAATGWLYEEYANSPSTEIPSLSARVHEVAR